MYEREREREMGRATIYRSIEKCGNHVTGTERDYTLPPFEAKEQFEIEQENKSVMQRRKKSKKN